MTVWQFATAHCVWCKNTEKFGKILNDSDKTNVICLRQRTDCLTLESELPIYNSNRILGRNLRMKFVIYILCAGVSWCPPHVSGQDQTGHRLAGRHGAGLACLPAWLLLLSLPLCTGVLSCYILHQHPLLADMTILVCMLHRDPNYLSLTNTNKTKRSKDATK